MQIVIEISSYDKDWITNGYYIPEEINISISEAIANGTPLPKGHGRLIDADKFISEHFGEVARLVDDAPTIIEADTESEDKE